MLRSLLLMLFVIALAACSNSSSNEQSRESASDAQAQMRAAEALVFKASHGAAKVDRTFEKHGLVGVVVRPTSGVQGRPTVVWMNQDGTLLFPGPAFNLQGEDVSTLEATEMGLLPRTTPHQTSVLLTQVAGKGTKAFVAGQKGPIVTAIVDLNCSHCNDFFLAALPLIEQGKLRVRYVLVGFLTPTSTPKAAAVLGADDPLVALYRAEADFRRHGASSLLPRADAAAEAVVKSNTQLLMGTPEPSTPYLLYCSESRQVVGAVGAPRDMQSFVATLSMQPHPACAQP